ncbi:MAG: ABC transporter ATP-binding protein [Oscillospiraceae bacterium]|jgi:putative ABC transport system ATP-binding protein|nr:ABC transporter ATP-binding protein [Oscillospiraceae bacterium]
MENVIEIKNIRKSYPIGDSLLEVLKGISLTVKNGEFLAVLGPSGSGKSTLMNVIGCMDGFDSGDYFLDGEAIHKMNDSKMTKIRNSKIGFIFQKYHLINKYSVLRNVEIPLLLRGYSQKEASEAAAQKLEQLGMGGRLMHKPNELSGGQQQRAAIARALVGKPSLLLADEPTGALDSATGKEVLELFTELHKAGNTIVMITHDLNVAKYAERIVNIIDGEIFDNK